MGRPIKKKYFGTPITAASGHIAVDGVKFSDGTTFTNAYIQRQVGTRAYIVQDSGMTHVPEIVTLANASAVSALQPGQCYITAVTVNGSLPCYGIYSHQLSTFNPDGTFSSYFWNPDTADTSAPTYANIMTQPGQVLSFNIVSGGFGYNPSNPPTVTVPGGTGLTYTVSIRGSVLTGINVLNSGTGYTATTGQSITVSAPPGASTPTGTLVVDGSGKITAINIGVVGGPYTTVPTVTITTSTGSGANITAILDTNSNRLTGFTINNGGSGYLVADTLNFPAPASVSTATATVNMA